MQPLLNRPAPRRRRIKATEAHHRRYNILLRIVKAANEGLDPQNVIGIIMDNIQKLIPCEAWSILLLSEDQAELVFERARGAGSDSLTYARLKVGEGIAGWVALRRKAVIVNDVAGDRRFNSKFDETTKFKTKSVLCAPLISRDHVMGVVELINKHSKTQRFTDRDMNTLLTLLGPIAVSLHNALLFQEKEKLAITDDLTKLFNNRFIHMYLHEMIDQHTKNQASFSLIFLDLDGFKSVNDHYGHLIGGQTLVEVGSLIYRIVQQHGVVARYGGDEFVVIMPGTGRDEALKTAERIRDAIENHDYLRVVKKEIHLSASLGISVFPAHADNITELIQKADQAMYKAKNSGKNATHVAF